MPQIGEGFDIDQNLPIYRTCLSLEMEDRSEPYEFLPPNHVTADTVYDMSSEDILKSLDMSLEGSLSFGSLSVDGGFTYASKAGKDEISETITIIRHVDRGLLRIHPDAVRKLNGLGQRALKESAANKRILCGQNFIETMSLSRGFMATLKITYFKKEDLLDLTGHLKIDTGRIEVAGQFFYKLQERARVGQLSLQVHSWGADAGMLTSVMGANLFECNQKRWGDDTTQATACVKAIGSLLEGASTFMSQAPRGQSQLEKARGYRVDQLQFGSYKRALDKAGNESGGWKGLELSAADRRRINLSIKTLTTQALDLERRKDLARRLMGSPLTLPLDQKAELNDFIAQANRLNALAESVISLCRAPDTNAARCQDRQELFSKQRTAFLKTLAPDLFEIRTETMAPWCYRLKFQRIPGLMGTGVKPELKLTELSLGTIKTLIDDFDLTGTHQAVDDLDNEDINCDRITNKTLQFFELYWQHPDQGIDFRVLASFRQVRTLHLQSKKLRDEDMASLVHFPFLREFSLTEGEISDLAALKNLRYLRTLHLDKSPIRDLFSLSGHRTLQKLELRGSASFSMNTNLPALRELILNEVSPNDLLLFLQDHAPAALRKISLDFSNAAHYPELICGASYRGIQITCTGIKP